MHTVPKNDLSGLRNLLGVDAHHFGGHSHGGLFRDAASAHGEVLDGHDLWRNKEERKALNHKPCLLLLT